jgi:hypothetical protein
MSPQNSSGKKNTFQVLEFGTQDTGFNTAVGKTKFHR